MISRCRGRDRVRRAAHSSQAKRTTEARECRSTRDEKRRLDSESAEEKEA